MKISLDVKEASVVTEVVARTGVVIPGGGVTALVAVVVVTVIVLEVGSLSPNLCCVASHTAGVLWT